MTRVDDTFIKEIIASGEDRRNLFAFTEPFSNPYDMDGVPLGLRRMYQLGLINPNLTRGGTSWEFFGSRAELSFSDYEFSELSRAFSDFEFGELS